MQCIRVEAENDIVDVEIWSQSAQLVRAFQFKRRNQGDTWGQQELIDELARWSGIAAQHVTATYEFVTDGRLGPTGINVRDALEKASDDDVDDILQLIDGKTKGVTVSSDSLRRASIRAEGSAYADLISGAEARAQGLLLNVTSQAEAEERGRWVVLELLNAVTERSGLTYEDDRVVTRDEVLTLLATPQDRIPTKHWDGALKDAFCASVVAQVEAQPVELACRPQTVVAGPKAAPKLLEDWAELDAVRLLAGRSGSGKSTVVLDMHRRAAERGTVVVAANAEDYIAGRLPALIAAGLNRHTYVGAHPAAGTAALADPDLTIALDGVTEIPDDTREQLEVELKQFLTAERRAALVLVGRGITAMRSMLTRGAATTELVVRSCISKCPRPVDYSWSSAVDRSNRP